MTGESTIEAPQTKNRVKMARYTIISGWILILLTTAATIGTALWIMAKGEKPPEVLIGWGGVCIGFLFNKLSDMVSRYIDLDRSTDESK